MRCNIATNECRKYTEIQLYLDVPFIPCDSRREGTGHALQYNLFCDWFIRVSWCWSRLLTCLENSPKFWTISFEKKTNAIILMSCYIERALTLLKLEDHEWSCIFQKYSNTHAGNDKLHWDIKKRILVLDLKIR